MEIKQHTSEQSMGHKGSQKGNKKIYRYRYKQKSSILKFVEFS